jgi:hypothetical protein
MRVLLASLIICLNLLVFCPKVSEAADEVKLCDSGSAPMTIDYGDIIKCKIKPIGDTDVYQFYGTVGDYILFFLSPMTAGSRALCLEIYDPDGISASGFPGRFCGDVSSPNVQYIPFEPTKTGMHSIIISEENGDQTFNYKIAMHPYFFSPGPDALTLPFPYHKRTDSLIQLDIDYYLINATAGDLIKLSLKDLTSGKPAPILYLIDPDQQPVAADPLEPKDGKETLDLLLDKTGIYNVIIFEKNFDQYARYQITLECINSGPEGCYSELLPTCGGKPVTIVGTDGDNIIVGTENDDVILALKGNDTIYGLGGKDTICGDQGDDTIFGGDLRDWLFGGGGNDVLRGEKGPDFLYGGDGNDSLDGGGGSDDLRGEIGCDTLFGGHGDDILFGGPDSDICDGGRDIGGDTADSSCEIEVEVP